MGHSSDGNFAGINGVIALLVVVMVIVVLLCVTRCLCCEDYGNGCDHRSSDVVKMMVKSKEPKEEDKEMGKQETDDEKEDEDGDDLMKSKEAEGAAGVTAGGSDSGEEWHSLSSSVHIQL